MQSLILNNELFFKGDIWICRFSPSNESHDISPLEVRSRWTSLFSSLPGRAVDVDVTTVSFSDLLSPKIVDEIFSSNAKTTYWQRYKQTPAECGNRRTPSQQLWQDFQAAGNFLKRLNFMLPSKQSRTQTGRNCYLENNIEFFILVAPIHVENHVHFVSRLHWTVPIVKLATKQSILDLSAISSIFMAHMLSLNFELFVHERIQLHYVLCELYSTFNWHEQHRAIHQISVIQRKSYRKFGRHLCCSQVEDVGVRM